MVDNILSNFDLVYIVVVIALTYSIIKIIDYCNGDKVVPTIWKRIILVISIIIVGSIYYIIGYDNTITLINSAIVCPIAWTWIIKPLLKRIGVDYRQIHEVID